MRLMHESEEKNSANFKPVKFTPYEDNNSASKDSYIMYFPGSRGLKKKEPL